MRYMSLDMLRLQSRKELYNSLSMGIAQVLNAYRKWMEDVVEKKDTANLDSACYRRYRCIMLIL